MDRKLIIITIDSEIQLAIFVEAGLFEKAKKAVSLAKEIYYKEECHSASFEDVLAPIFRAQKIPYGIVKHYEM